MRNQAIFLDRDGTLIHPRHFPTRPEEIVLYDGVESELRTLQEAGFRLIVVTNQSGIARGLFSMADLEAMHRHLVLDLNDRGVRIDAIYHCPHHPDGSVAEFAHACACRKPSPGMLLSASDDLLIDLSASWFVGDILDDIEAGNRAGCRTVLVDLGTESKPADPVREPTVVASDIRHALRLILACEGVIQDRSAGIVPDRWREADGFASLPDPVLSHATRPVLQGLLR